MSGRGAGSSDHRAYEYYIESMEDPIEKPLPQIIRMYFSYNNTLDYRKKAFVYANVIRNKDKDPKAYQSYRPAMEKLWWTELMSAISTTTWPFSMRSLSRSPS